MKFDGLILPLFIAASLVLSFICFFLLRKIKSQRRILSEKDREILEWKLRGSEFVANVSHELKTPLTSIKGYTETLKTAILRDPSRAADFLTKIEENTDRLSRLINDILELSRIEQPNTYLERTDFSIDKLFEEIRDRYQHRFSERHQVLSLSSEVANLKADRWLAEQAISNLVENAHRYCQDGAHISVTAETYQEAGRSYILISVSDDGPGINPEDLPRIFERFYRAEKSRNRLFGGTGLGLAIVKHIMLSHNGSARIESRVGEGSKFQLLFLKD